jgi:hypothetical protein
VIFRSGGLGDGEGDGSALGAPVAWPTGLEWGAACGVEAQPMLTTSAPTSTRHLGIDMAVLQRGSVSVAAATWTGYFVGRTRSRNSARVRGSRRNVPSMQEVIIRPPGVSTPRISMHR